MEWVDGRLRSEGAPIVARPLRAESILAVELGEQFVHPYPRRPPTEGSYRGNDLTIRVNDWFDARYGERLKMDLSPGSAVVLIRGDPWLMRFPRFWGSWDIVTEDPPDDRGEGVHRIGRLGDPPAKYNCIRSVVDLPGGLRSALHLRERAELLVNFREFLDAFHSLHELRSSELVRQARADVDAAVGHLLGPGSNPALSKWSSLQAAEKMLKEFIRARGQQFRQTHQLIPLLEHAERLGLPGIPPHILQKVQCGPAIRYGGVAVDVAEAVAAHHESLRIALHVTRSLGVGSIYANSSTP